MKKAATSFKPVINQSQKLQNIENKLIQRESTVSTKKKKRKSEKNLCKAVMKRSLKRISESRNYSKK